MSAVAVDLFGWRELKMAEAAVAAAHAVQAEARRKAAWAPHGLKREREQALKTATLAALRAELALATARRQVEG